LVNQRIREYELVAILSPEASDEEVGTEIERLNGFISDRGGSVSDHESWGLRRLAFPIRKFSEGNYIMTKFELGPQHLIDLSGHLESSESVLRHLVTRV
jgi:small subunit ribosomal protein S6